METSSPTDETNNSTNDPSLSSYHQYLVFWIGQNLSILGSAVVMFAVFWEMAEIIGESNTLLSFAGFLSFLPFILFSPIAGVVADKYNKKKIIIISDSLQALLTFSLFLIMITTETQLWHFLLLNSLRSICQAFHAPIGFTLVSYFVPKDKITRINGLNVLFQNLVNIIAAPIAVLLLLVVDLKILLWLDILSFIIAVIPLLKLHIPKNGKKSTAPIDSHQVQEPKKTSFVQEFKEGFKAIKDIPGMVNMLIMATFLNFFFQPFDTLLINFVKYTHGGSIQEFGILTSRIRVGVFIGAIIVSIKKKWHHWVMVIGGGIISMGIVTLYIVSPYREFSDAIYWSCLFDAFESDSKHFGPEFISIENPSRKDGTGLFNCYYFHIIYDAVGHDYRRSYCRCS